MSDIVQEYPSSQSPSIYFVINPTIRGITIILGKFDLFSTNENSKERDITNNMVSIIIYVYYLKRK